MKHSPFAVTALWIGLNLVLIFAVLTLCFVVESWLLRFVFLLLYVVIVVPYGFFIAMPLMVKAFRKPASMHVKR